MDSSECPLNATKQGVKLARQLEVEAALLYVIDENKTMGNLDTCILPAEALIAVKKEVEKTLDELSDMYGDQNLLKFMPEG